MEEKVLIFMVGWQEFGLAGGLLSEVAKPLASIAAVG